MFQRSLALANGVFSGHKIHKTVKNCFNPKKVKGEEKKQKVTINKLHLYKMRSQSSK
jgi:hypothetical protein